MRDACCPGLIILRAGFSGQGTATAGLRCRAGPLDSLPGWRKSASYRQGGSARSWRPSRRPVRPDSRPTEAIPSALEALRRVRAVLEAIRSGSECSAVADWGRRTSSGDSSPAPLWTQLRHSRMGAEPGDSAPARCLPGHRMAGCFHMFAGKSRARNERLAALGPVYPVDGTSGGCLVPESHPCRANFATGKFCPWRPASGWSGVRCHYPTLRASPWLLGAL